jgi:hypothetical protein
MGMCGYIQLRVKGAGKDGVGIMENDFKATFDFLVYLCRLKVLRASVGRIFEYIRIFGKMSTNI